MIQSLPKIGPVRVPPIKSQGIKTKLVPLITSSIQWCGKGRWIEPFLGSGVVVFNVNPRSAVCADTNPHIIELYKAIKDRRLKSREVRIFLNAEGSRLLTKGEEHYYYVRDRFNKSQDPLDFLFLNRSCFNGVIRFNSRGLFNVPFCKKPERFRAAYVTKIVNQILWLENLLPTKDWVFEVSNWRTILDQANSKDFVYVDPPYVGRHTDYYSSWTEEEADDLALALRGLRCGFAYSMWLRNRYRENEHLRKWFSDYPMETYGHFYHVGSSEDFRNDMEEALVIHPDHLCAANSRPISK